MQIRYLGTAAAEGVPAVFCDCTVCKKSREAGGRNIRTRSQALIDGRILIDFGPDTYFHSITHGVELSKIHTCIITHNHNDHLYPAEIKTRNMQKAHPVDSTPLTFYATYPGYEALACMIIHSKMDGEGRVIAKRVQEFCPFEAEGYKITPLKAAHDARCEPVFYAVEKDGKALLYAHDTGFFPEETWEFLKGSGMHFDLVSLDCTEPMTDLRIKHMSLGAAGEVRDKLCALGLADGGTRFVLNHFSHNGKVTYDELVPIAKDAGFEVSYDGMCIGF